MAILNSFGPEGTREDATFFRPTSAMKRQQSKVRLESWVVMDEESKACRTDALGNIGEYL